MITKKEIIEIIFESIEDINKENDIEIIKDLNTKLFGIDSQLDSILLVNLIVSIEEKIEVKTSRYIPIADERAFNLEDSPFICIGTFVNHIEFLLNE